VLFNRDEWRSSVLSPLPAMSSPSSRRVGCTAFAAVGSLTVTWDPNPEAEVLGYVVHVGT
jgi:hypothetical protein